MSRLWMLACTCACALTLTAIPANADDAKKGDATAVIVAALENEVQLKEGSNINDIPLFELIQELSKKHGLTFVINENSFKQAGLPNIRDEKPTLAATQLRGLQLQQFLRVTLDSMGAAYLIKNNVIEIVSAAHAAKVTKSAVSQDEEGRTRLAEPLVSAIFKEAPLKDAVAAVAEKYDLTVVVSPQAGEGRAGPVSARLLNVPADKALELLALQNDLRVMRRGAAFLITSKEHATELYNEKTDKERERIELDRLRQAPAKPADKPAGALPGFADPLWYFRNLPHYDGFHVPFGGGVPITPGQPPVPAAPAPKPKQ